MKMRRHWNMPTSVRGKGNHSWTEWTIRPPMKVPHRPPFVVWKQFWPNSCTGMYPWKVWWMPVTCGSSICPRVIATTSSCHFRT
eukprot:scaffold39580_cov62-Attheya_sp.AAC.2